VKSEGLRFGPTSSTSWAALRLFRRTAASFLNSRGWGLPRWLRTFGDLQNGLVLVGGPTGSGQVHHSRPLIDYINRTSSRHIISLEDPIEVVHQAQRASSTSASRHAHASFALGAPVTCARTRTSSGGRAARPAHHRVHGRRRGDRHLVFGVHTVSAATHGGPHRQRLSPGQQQQVARPADSRAR